VSSGLSANSAIPVTPWVVAPSVNEKLVFGMASILVTSFVAWRGFLSRLLRRMAADRRCRGELASGATFKARWELASA